MSAFGPTPIPPTPGALQASFIAQQGTGPRPREKARPQDADGRSGAARGIVRDEVRLSDPAEAQAVDSKPDAAEEWKHQRGGQQDAADNQPEGRELNIVLVAPRDCKEMPDPIEYAPAVLPKH